MTVSEMARMIGTDRLLRVESLMVGVKVLDVRKSYGKVQLSVSPISGEGSQWVDMDRTRAIETAQVEG